jgi:hypothetical protein
MRISLLGVDHAPVYKRGMTQPAAEQWSAHVQQSSAINPEHLPSELHPTLYRDREPQVARKPESAPARKVTRGTLAVVEAVLRATTVPMSVRQIVEMAGSTLPTRSKTPDTVVARDLAMDIKNKGADSDFVRTSPGRFTMREFVAGSQSA